MHFVNITDQRPAVAPWRGRDGRFGTNPVCVALPGPAPTRPIIADMATSRIAMGKVRVARNKGQQIAAETLLDAGRRADDRSAMSCTSRPRGALLTFGEHKGYALAFICEMLAGAVTGSGTMRPERQKAEGVTNGMLTVVIDPSRLVDQEWMKDEIGAMADYITASPPRRPDEPVLIPGDPERANRAARLARRRPDRRRDLARDRRGGARRQRAGRGVTGDVTGYCPDLSPRRRFGSRNGSAVAACARSASQLGRRCLVAVTAQIGDDADRALGLCAPCTHSGRAGSASDARRACTRPG